MVAGVPVCLYACSCGAHREADLARVLAEAAGADREQHVQGAVAGRLEERQEHRRLRQWGPLLHVQLLELDGRSGSGGWSCRHGG